MIGRLANYLKESFKAESISELSDDELDRTYRAVASKKWTWLKEISLEPYSKE